jgi:rhamnose transport system permease protein
MGTPKVSSWLRSRELLLLVIFVGVIVVNIQLSPFFLGVDNLVNVFQLSIEKAIMALIMTLIIISGEIDLSIAAVMGLCATLFGWFYRASVPLPLAAMYTLGVGALCGAFNGMWIAYLGLPSLAVTLAGLIGYRGLGYVILEEKSVTNFPGWFSALGQSNIPGLPFPATLIVFVVLFALLLAVLHYAAFGRYVFAIGNNKEAAHFSGVRVHRIKMILYIASGLVAALAGLVYAARVGTVRANVAEGFELDVITMVVLGGVSIFGGSGTLVGVGLSVLIVLTLRNGMTLANIHGSIRDERHRRSVDSILLLPNLFRDAREWWRRVKPEPVLANKEEVKPSATRTVGEANQISKERGR